MGQQSANLDFYQQPIVREVLPAIDTVQNYAGFLVDSINPEKADSVFRFELKEIVIPEQTSDSASLQPVYIPSIFVVSKNQPNKIIPSLRQSTDYDWLAALLLVCLIILAWVKYYNTRRIKQLFKAVAARHNVNQLVRDGNLVEERITPGLALVYLSGIAIIAFQFGSETLGQLLRLPNSLIFLIIIAGLSILWLIKLMLIRLTGFIFKTKQDTNELVLTNLIFNGGIGILIFPFVVAGFYSGNLLLTRIAIGILLTGMILRFFRSLLVGLSAQTFSVLYLFTYLCTLEILPVLFLYKVMFFIDL
ncbi:MAG: DUF4271 domain-containing protein [Lentimicrobium sp.]|nr:DUF4271 domain-containing protein [Lentimicrobium sp.]